MDIKKSKRYLQKSFFNFTHKFLLVVCLTMPNSAFASMSEIRLKTLLNICESAQSNGDTGTAVVIAEQIKSANLNLETDLGLKAMKCLEFAFPSNDKVLEYEDLIDEINKMQIGLKALCFDLLELNPRKAISFVPCQSFY